MSAILKYPCQKLYQALDTQRLPLKKFAWAAAPGVGVFVLEAQSVMRFGWLPQIYHALGRPFPEWLKWPAGTSVNEIILELYDYSKAGLFSGVSAIALVAFCVFAGVLGTGALLHPCMWVLYALTLDAFFTMLADRKRVLAMRADARPQHFTVPWFSQNIIARS